ncbi:MFS transporter [Yinghuangia soli]|uniref:MFS transporter n=1 Tax=Yinghuangia soli TaxID=2908204 RepID=A0AA41PY89_9ACTN|nr:MFS transporter [Yinghuangia soli]MCF2527391.1 MFS transporter [Yinghuangia soli]
MTAAEPGLDRAVRGRDLFADRRFLILFAARTISVLGASFGPVALAFGVLDLPGADATTLTIVLTAQTVPQVAGMLFGGVIADRMPRFRLMMAAELLSAAASAALAVMFVTGHAPVPAIAGFAALTGLALALYYPALTGVVPDVVAADRLQTANGVLRLGVNSARLLGMALAGVTVAVVGAGWALAVNAAGFLLSVGLIATLRVPPRTDRARTSVLTDLREGWQEFSARQWLWAIVLQFAFVVAAMQAAFGVLGPVVAKAELGGAPAWSAILAAQGAGTMIGVVFAIRIRPRRPLAVATVSTFAMAVPITLLGLGAPVYVVAAGAFVMGVSHDVFGVLWETTMQREIPREALSRVSAYDALGSFMFGPLGLIAAAPLADAVGARHALLLCAGLIVLATAAALCAPEVRNLRAPANAARPEEGTGSAAAALPVPDGTPDAVPGPRGSAPVR